MESLTLTPELKEILSAHMRLYQQHYAYTVWRKPDIDKPLFEGHPSRAAAFIHARELTEQDIPDSDIMVVPFHHLDE